MAHRPTKRILVGAHRWQAAKAEGLTQVPVHWKDCDEAEALRIIIADNRSHDLGGWDDTGLLETLQNIGYAGTLFDLDSVETLRAKVGPDIAPMPEFKGDYADAGEEQEARKAAAEKLSAEMRDVVLVLSPQDYAQFQADVKTLAKRWSLPGVIAVTMAAVRRAAQEEGDLIALQLRLSVAREWAKKLLYAVPMDEAADFKEIFGL